MKQLTLLKPDRKTVYLDNGRGQEVDSEEEGLMAASYLAGIYNWKDEIYEDWYEFSEEIPFESSEDAKELTG